MKTKHVLLGLGLFVVVAVIWFGRAAWQVRHQLVTLNVRNAPLVDVLRSVERQTRTKIRAEKNLDTRVTLNVTAKPLAYVLNRIAEQAGARWSTVYAVYESGPALKNLETALRGETKLEAAGWTRIAPAALEVNLPGDDSHGGRRIFQPGAKDLISNLPPGAMVATEDVALDRAPGNQPGKSGPSAARRERSPMVVRVVSNGKDGSGNAVEETWSPEEMVLESALSPRLGSERAEAANPQTAAETAEKVKGHWAIYYALKQSRITAGLGNVQMSRRMFGDPAARGAGPPGAQPGPGVLIERNGPGPAMADLEAAMRQHRADELGRLTPEQRVQRARARLSYKPN